MRSVRNSPTTKKLAPAATDAAASFSDLRGARIATAGAFVNVFVDALDQYGNTRLNYGTDVFTGSVKQSGVTVLAVNSSGAISPNRHKFAVHATISGSYRINVALKGKAVGNAQAPFLVNPDLVVNVTTTMTEVQGVLSPSRAKSASCSLWRALLMP